MASAEVKRYENGGIHIRHRGQYPRNRNGLSLNVTDDGIWFCVTRHRGAFLNVALSEDEARVVRDWLSEQLGD